MPFPWNFVTGHQKEEIGACPPTSTPPIGCPIAINLAQLDIFSHDNQK